MWPLIEIDENFPLWANMAMDAGICTAKLWDIAKWNNCPIFFSGPVQLVMLADQEVGLICFVSEYLEAYPQENLYSWHCKKMMMEVDIPVHIEDGAPTRNFSRNAAKFIPENSSWRSIY